MSPTGFGAYRDGDTLVAVASPPGPAAAAALRLSGPGAFALAQDHFEPVEAPSAGFFSYRRRLACRGRWRVAWSSPGTAAGSSGRVPALVYLCPGPRSYTREDVVEALLPGAPPVTAAAMRALTAAGARPAEPGEFAWRAFVHGRIDAREAAALSELTRARNDALRRRALARLTRCDPVNAALHRLRDELWHSSARLEAALDFPEHADGADPAAAASPDPAWRELAEGLDALAGTRNADDADGGLPRIRFAGLTNAGKSSLFNALSGGPAALASSERSTTRDRLSVKTVWDGFAVLLEDLPGFDPAGPRGRDVAPERRLAELLGPEDAAGGRTALVAVVDASRPPDAEWSALLPVLAGRRLLVARHKADLPSDPAWLDPSVPFGPDVTVAATVDTSARDGRGLAELRHALRGELARETDDEASAAESPWEREGWRRAAEECRRAAEEWEAGFGELSAERLRLARGWLSGGWGVGDADAEALLARIFGSLCVGK